MKKQSSELGAVGTGIVILLLVTSLLGIAAGYRAVQTPTRGTKAADCATVNSVSSSVQSPNSGQDFTCNATIDSGHSGSYTIGCGWSKNGSWPSNGGRWVGATCNGTNCSFGIRMDANVDTSATYDLVAYDFRTECGPSTGKRITLRSPSGSNPQPTNTPTPTPIPSNNCDQISDCVQKCTCKGLTTSQCTILCSVATPTPTPTPITGGGNQPSECFSAINLNPWTVPPNTSFTCSFTIDSSKISPNSLNCGVQDTNSHQFVPGANCVGGANGNSASFSCRSPANPGYYDVIGFSWAGAPSTCTKQDTRGVLEVTNLGQNPTNTPTPTPPPSTSCDQISDCVQKCTCKGLTTSQCTILCSVATPTPTPTPITGGGNQPSECFSAINLNPWTVPPNTSFTCSFTIDSSKISPNSLNCGVQDTNSHQFVPGANCVGGANGNSASFSCRSPANPGYYDVIGYSFSGAPSSCTKQDTRGVLEVTNLGQNPTNTPTPTPTPHRQYIPQIFKPIVDIINPQSKEEVKPTSISGKVTIKNSKGAQIGSVLVVLYNGKEDSSGIAGVEKTYQGNNTIEYTIDNLEYREYVIRAWAKDNNGAWYLNKSCSFTSDICTVKPGDTKNMEIPIGAQGGRLLLIKSQELGKNALKAVSSIPVIGPLIDMFIVSAF